MARKLIINADDFGLTGGVNRSIHELASLGALSSATLMANSDRFEDAVRIARATKSLGVGCHVVLTDGIPLCAPEQIPSLIDKDGKSFRASLKDFWVASLLGKVNAADVEKESAAQIAKLQASGIPVTHVDTHKHTHILPVVAAPLLRVAERLAVRAVRNPFESAWSLALSHGNIQRSVQVRLMSFFRKSFEVLPQIRSGVISTTDGTIGISATGRLDQNMLQKLLLNIPEGSWELVCHPGFNDADLGAVETRLRHSREVEYQALLSTFSQTSSHPFGVELIHYGMLPDARSRANQSFMSK